MVGIFSRFSGSKNGHRRTQSALDERNVLPPATEATEATDTATVGGVAFAVGHGIEVAIEFKPVEHPTEPLDNDRPIQCPLPEPSILNDGRIWKERVCAGEQRRTDVPVMQSDVPTEPEASELKNRPPRPPRSRSNNRMILPSISAPEHNILKLLEECNSSGI